MSFRATEGFLGVKVTTIQRAVPTTGQTVTVLQTNAPDITLVVDPAGTLLTLTIAFPTGAFEGQKISFMSTQILTGLTLVSATGTLTGALTSLALNGFGSYVWSTSQAKWYRIG